MRFDIYTDEELDIAIRRLSANEHSFGCLKERLKRMLEKSQHDLESVDEIRTLGRVQGKVSSLKSIIEIIAPS